MTAEHTFPSRPETQHERDQRVHRERRPFSCPICGKRLRKQRSINDHYVDFHVRAANKRAKRAQEKAQHEPE